MSIYGIKCGECGGTTFKHVEGKDRCQDCGYILSGEDIERLLRQANIEEHIGKAAYRIRNARGIVKSCWGSRKVYQTVKFTRKMIPQLGKTVFLYEDEVRQEVQRLNV